jgi:hypothetical protein
MLRTISAVLVATAVVLSAPAFATDLSRGKRAEENGIFERAVAHWFVRTDENQRKVLHYYVDAQKTNSGSGSREELRIEVGRERCTSSGNGAYSCRGLQKVLAQAGDARFSVNEFLSEGTMKLIDERGRKHVVRWRGTDLPGSYSSQMDCGGGKKETRGLARPADASGRLFGHTLNVKLMYVGFLARGVSFGDC